MSNYTDYKVEYDRFGRVLYFENLETKHWYSREYNSEGKLVYHEDSELGVLTSKESILETYESELDYVSQKFFADDE